MSSSNFFYINRNQLDLIYALFDKQSSSDYVLINKFNGFCKIAKYNPTYDTVVFLTVRENNL